ncbi:hypothetical protein ACQ0RB_11060, partial [Gaetbulibacter sp. PBL-D1]
MRKRYLKLALLFFFTFICQNVKSQSGIYESYIIIEDGTPSGKYYDLQATTGNDDFNNFDLGIFSIGNDLILKGFQNKTDKCNTDDILNATLHYRIYLQSDMPTGFNSFSTINVINQEDNPNCESNLAPFADSRQTWEDNTQTINIVNGLASGDYYFEVYTTSNYTWTDNGGGSGTHFADNASNYYRSSFRVDDPPIAICTNYVAQLDSSGNVSISAANVDGGSTDDFGIASMSVSPNTFDCSNVGANTVTLTVTDNNGSVSTCSATVTVQDNTAPTAVCQNATVVLDASGNGSITTSDIDNGSNDACGIASLSLDQTSFDCTNIGANTVTLTVTDNNGNVSTCSATVTVED